MSKRQIPASGRNFVGEDVDAIMRMDEKDGIEELKRYGTEKPGRDVALGMWLLLERDRERRMKEASDLRLAKHRLRGWMRRLDRILSCPARVYPRKEGNSGEDILGLAFGDIQVGVTRVAVTMIRECVSRALRGEPVPR